MEHDRFDDVEFRIVEEPTPPRRPPRLRRRWVLGAVACTLMTGALAAGASALTGGSDEPAKAVTPAKERGWTEYAPLSDHGDGDRPCRRGERKHQRESSSVRY